MNFTCDRKTLSEAVVNISPAVAPKSSLVALEGILLSCDNGRLTLTGYNLDLGIKKTIHVEEKESGSIILNARLFGDILRKLSSEKVYIHTDEKLLTIIKGDETEYTILGLASNEYPEMPSLRDEKFFSIKSAALKTMISQTIYAVSQSEKNPVHTGALFDIKDNDVNMVALDGYRLSMRHEKINKCEDMSFIVPGKTLSEIQRLIPENSEEEIGVYVSYKHIIFEINGYELISRLIEGIFHDYNSAIQKEFKTTVIADRRELINCIERAAIIIVDRMKSPIKAYFGDDYISVSCVTAMGKINDGVSAEIEGEPVTIGFNNKYMLDALKAAECDKIKISLAERLRPITITPVDSDEFLFIVLPVDIKE